MKRSLIPTTAGFLLLLFFSACAEPDGVTPAALDTQTPDPSPDQAPAPEQTPLPPGPREATLSHSFGDFELDPFEERSPCVQWTLNNDAPLYVEKVTLSNNGAYHHSNWFVVPEDVFEGADGFFRCSRRDFEELEAALLGTVLFAQSTQSQYEEQFLADGVVIKIPPRHKVIADVHLLNLAPRTSNTELRMSLDLIHPGDVEVVVTPFRLSYLALDIPPLSKAHFTGDCPRMAEVYSRVAGRPFDLKLYWPLPHFHQLGDYFALEIIGGDRDGERIYTLDSFNADANGLAFNPPLDLTGADGLRFTCGYTNPNDKRVGWGIGDQEMCVMLGFAAGGAMIDASVITQNEVVSTDSDGTVQNEGPCLTYALPRNSAQTMPDQDEIDTELYVPEGGGPQDEVSPSFECEDTPAEAVAESPVSLTSVRESVFEPGCTFGACHTFNSPAGGLRLTGDGLHEVLMEHPGRGHTTMPLIDPGNAEGSWLYHVLSRCEPSDEDGSLRSHMPLNAPTLMEPGLVAKVRDWIDAGAPND